MPMDNLLILAPDGGLAVTASTNGTGVLIAGIARGRSLYARIRYNSAANASGANAVQFKIQHSDDNITYYDHVVDADQALTLSTTAAEGLFYLPISTDKPYVRLAAAFSGSGTSPTLKYAAEIMLSKA